MEHRFEMKWFSSITTLIGTLKIVSFWCEGGEIQNQIMHLFIKALKIYVLISRIAVSIFTRFWPWGHKL